MHITKTISFWLKIFSITCLLIIAGGVFYYWQQNNIQKNNYPDVFDFEYDRDAQAIKNIFYQNWHWLIASDDFSTEFMLRKKAPNNRNSLYFGKLIIKALRPDDGSKLAGFICYYKKYDNLGWLLFLGVDEQFRKRGYGEYLVRYALDQMKLMGLPRVDLVTRVANYRAQRLYKRIGFNEYKRDSHGFVYFAYNF